jgi:hypothetical protein
VLPEPSVHGGLWFDDESSGTKIRALPGGKATVHDPTPKTGSEFNRSIIVNKSRAALTVSHRLIRLKYSSLKSGYPGCSGFLRWRWAVPGDEVIRDQSYR